jgi:hypothetical protein
MTVLACNSTKKSDVRSSNKSMTNILLSWTIFPSLSLLKILYNFYCCLEMERVNLKNSIEKRNQDESLWFKRYFYTNRKIRGRPVLSRSPPISTPVDIVLHQEQTTSGFYPYGTSILANSSPHISGDLACGSSRTLMGGKGLRPTETFDNFI